MADKLYVVTESDRMLMQQYLDQQRRQITNAKNRPPDRSEDYLTPEVYCALIPSDGIQGSLNMFRLAKATCEIYQLNFNVGGVIVGTGTDIFGYDAELQDANFSEDVYNPTAGAIDGDQVVLIERDKFGSWFIAGGNVTASGNQVGMVLVQSSTVASDGTYSGLLQKRGPYHPLQSQSVVRLSPANGETLKSGHYYEALTWGFDANDVPVYLTACCPDDDTGTGSGTNVPNLNCCPLRSWPIADTFCLTISNFTFALPAGACVLNGKYTLTFGSPCVILGGNGCNQGCWTSDTFVACPPASGFTTCRFVFCCIGPAGPGTATWRLTLNGGGVSTTVFTAILACPTGLESGLPGLPMMGNTSGSDDSTCSGKAPWSYDWLLENDACTGGTGSEITPPGTGTSSGVISPCFTSPVPVTLHVTITSLSGCSCMTGSYAVTWNGSSWVGTYTVCSGHSLAFLLTCEGTTCGNMILTIVCGTGIISNISPDTCSSSPLMLTYNGGGMGLSMIGSCCTGTIEATVTP